MFTLIYVVCFVLIGVDFVVSSCYSCLCYLELFWVYGLSEVWLLMILVGFMMLFWLNWFAVCWVLGLECLRLVGCFAFGLFGVLGSLLLG